VSKVLVVGSGGREHAVAHALARSPKVSEVLAAPGNPGIGACARVVDVAADDVAGLVALARAEAVDLVFVGPEGPLVAGLADALGAAGVRVLGPSAACARLEGSKAFAKAVMDEAGVPTARWGRFTDVTEAVAWLHAAPFDVVVKASGLAAGKGVVVPASKQQAEEAVRAFLGGSLGEAGRELVLEELLIGEEVSLLAFCSGTDFAVMPAAQDHKRIFEGDRGPNTGGMGAYAPAPLAAGREAELAEATLRPVLRAFAARGTPFRGILYAGLMVTADGVRVLEYNTRFGDPETQVLLPLLDTDLFDVACAVADGTLASQPVRWKAGAAITVVLAAAGYPGTVRKGDPISGLEGPFPDGVTVYHAGTGRSGDRVVTAGGRVLAVTGVGPTLGAARDRAYAAAETIHFEGSQLRRDIGHRALAAGRSA
jgi:phosphoribosylamine--glycine ligase